MEKLNDFMMLFRLEPNLNYKPTEQDLIEQKKQWGSWIGGIAAQAKLVNTHQLGFSGKQLHADMSVEETINISNNKMLAGNMVVKANSMDDALEMAKGCPILSMGGSLEIRDIIPM
ncbi:MAG: hypothetical protein V4580_13310 [Bacteroidota bacterium]